MTGINRFFAAEREQAGWRFWLIWVIATNIGWFAGIGIGQPVARMLIPDPNPLISSALQATISAFFPGLLVGLMQSLVLRHHSTERGQWIAATLPGWMVGIFSGVLILGFAVPTLDSNSMLYILLLGDIAGLVVGITQMLVLARHGPRAGWWWIPVSGVAWLVFFPGMVTGIVLVLLLRRNSTG